MWFSSWSRSQRRTQRSPGPWVLLSTANAKESKERWWQILPLIILVFLAPPPLPCHYLLAPLPSPQFFNLSLLPCGALLFRSFPIHPLDFLLVLFLLMNVPLSFENNHFVPLLYFLSRSCPYDSYNLFLLYSFTTLFDIC